MPTPLDRALNQRNLFLGFAGVVTAVTAWSIWNGNVFPEQAEPAGEPESWSEDDMKRWLKKRNLAAGHSPTREELIAMVRAGMTAPKA